MGCETISFFDGAADAAFFEVIMVISSIMHCFGKVSTMRQFLHKSVHVKTVHEPENFEQEKLGSVFREKKSVRAAFSKTCDIVFHYCYNSFI